VPPRAELPDQEGRPLQICSGTPIPALIR